MVVKSPNALKAPSRLYSETRRPSRSSCRRKTKIQVVRALRQHKGLECQHLVNRKVDAYPLNFVQTRYWGWPCEVLSLPASSKDRLMKKTSDAHSIPQQLREVKQHDEVAITRLWEHFYPALVKLAEKRLSALGVPQRAFNGEDVAASAMASFFRAVQRGRFPELDSEDGLFRLLRRITIRKVIDRKRQSQTLKAGSGEVRGESAFGSNSAKDSVSGPGIDGVQGDSPSPDEVAMIEEECQGLFAKLPKEELQRIVCLRLEGRSNSEIATTLGCSVATIERRIKEIRACWTMAAKNKQEPTDA